MVARSSNPWDHLSFIESYFEAGNLEKAWQEVERAREAFPDNPTILEWYAVLAGDDGRPFTALEAVERVLALEPKRAFALREKTAILLALGRFEDALEILLEIGPERADDRTYYFDVAHCFDRIGEYDSANKYFSKAAELDPEGFGEPGHFTDDEFDEMVDEALLAQPEVLKPYLENTVLVFQEYPGVLDGDPLRLVRFQRRPITVGEAAASPGTGRRRSRRRANRDCDRLFIYTRCLEIEYPDPDVLIDELCRAIGDELFVVLGLEDDPSGDG